MPRILVAECKQEVSTFNPHESSADDFDLRKGAALFDYHRTVGTEVGGVLDVLEKTPGVEAVPTYGACFITSGGPLAAEPRATSASALGSCVRITSDASTFDDSLDELMDFSAKYPELEITPKKIRENFKQRAESAAEAEAIGAKLNKKLLPITEPMLYRR
mgnify:CR=1 FL=1